MYWNKTLINFYQEFYAELKEYEITPYRADYRLKEFPHKENSFRAPDEDTAILNIEFDLGIKLLGELGEYVYRTQYLHQDLPRRFSAASIEDKVRMVKGELVKILLGFNDPKKSRMSEAYKMGSNSRGCR